jgi:hypothetical protein
MPMVTITCPRPARSKRIGQHLPKFLLLRNDVIGRKHRHDGAGGALPGNGRAERDGGAGVAPTGSAMTFLAGSRGSCLRTAAACAALVMMRMLSSGTSGSTRSTACWRKERLPSNVINCLGIFSRLTGQNRSPRPPAMMITNRSLFCFDVFSCLSPSLWAGNDAFRPHDSCLRKGPFCTFG